MLADAAHTLSVPPPSPSPSHDDVAQILPVAPLPDFIDEVVGVELHPSAKKVQWQNGFVTALPDIRLDDKHNSLLKVGYARLLTMFLRINKYNRMQVPFVIWLRSPRRQKSLVHS